MRAVCLIATRDLRAYFTTFSGYAILAGHLLLTGLLFNVYALEKSKYSQRVLEDFFYLSSGIAMVTAVLLSLRMIAEERQLHTLVLLRTAPLVERDIIWGKFLSGLIFFGVALLISFYLPMLVWIHGRVSLGQILAGYLGLFLLGASCIAIALLASTWSRSQLMAGCWATVMVSLLLLAWMAAKVSAEPLKGLLNYLALHNIHFLSFSRGVIHLRDVAYYLGVTVFFLECAVRSLEAWSWRE